MRAARLLFEAGKFPGCVAVCTGALAKHPDNLDLRLLYARALLAMRRVEEAEQELRECLRRNSNFGPAYRLYGEVLLRRDRHGSSQIFLKEALRLDPDDSEATELLEIVNSLYQPTAAVEKLPAATVAVGCSSFPKPRRAPTRPPRLAKGTENDTVPDARQPVSQSGFGEYLVQIGALTPQQLQATLAYHRSAGVRIGAAAATLGFISEPKLEWAAHAYHARRRPE